VIRTHAPPVHRLPAAQAQTGKAKGESFWRRPLTPRTLAFLFLTLALAPELKFRYRDPAAAFSGKPDLQVLFELALYGLVAIWVGWHLAHGVAARTYRLSSLNLPMSAALLTVAVVLVSGASALSRRSTIRALQYAELVGMVVFLYWEARRDREFFPTFWMWLRRGTIAVAAFSSLVTAAVPGFAPWVDDDGVSRYRWFEIHPIVTAGMLGLAIFMLVSIYVASPDRMFLRKPWKITAAGLGAVFAGLLLMTRSRGSLVATLVALVILLMFSPRGQRRRIAVAAALAVAVASLLLFLTVGSELLESWILREQTWEQVSTMSQRTELFTIGGQLFSEKPIFGHGYLIAGAKFRTYFNWAGHAHNVLLEIAVSMGAVGVLAFAFLLLVIIGRLWQGAMNSSARSTGVPAEGFALVALLIGQGVISDSFGGPVGYETAGLMLAALMACQFAPRGQRLFARVASAP
jgi:exopolysaccharide production protein ExoQ